jgi:methylglutaconyl-CoA hydratase
MKTLKLETDARGVATVTLARPEVHNAFDDRLIAELTALLERLAQDDTIRVVCLAGEGKSFSAGADLNWMRRVAGYTYEENLDDAQRLANLLRILNDLPHPTVARVQGAAFGGGTGLVACCDIAVATRSSRFGLTEVRLGLIPSVISPYVIAAIGPRAARRYFLTGERFDAGQAHRIGLVHEVTDEDGLDEGVERMVSALLESGPRAVAAAKNLIAAIRYRPIDETLSQDTAERIADVRSSNEAVEGVSAFLEKRPPGWRI